MEREELQTRETVERMREREEEWRIYTWTKIYIYIYITGGNITGTDIPRRRWSVLVHSLTRMYIVID